MRYGTMISGVVMILAGIACAAAPFVSSAPMGSMIVTGGILVAAGVAMTVMGKWLANMFKGMPKMPGFGESMRAASQSMDQASQMLAQQTNAQNLAVTGKAATVQVMAVRDTGSLINFDPVLEFDLLVTLGDAPPYPVMAHRQLVSKIVMGRIAPGNSYNARVDKDQPQKLHINWV